MKTLGQVCIGGVFWFGALLLNLCSMALRKCGAVVLWVLLLLLPYVLEDVEVQPQGLDEEQA